MKKHLVSFGLLLPLAACVAAPSEETASTSGAVSVAPDDAGARLSPCITLFPQDPTPNGGILHVGGLGSIFCPVPVSSFRIAPGQTDDDLQVDVDVAWSSSTPPELALSVSGLPAGVTATWVPSSGAISAGQPLQGAFSFSASPATPPQTTPITLTAQSSVATGSTTINLVVGGVCVPSECIPGQCGSPPDGCSGVLSCGGCASNAICTSDFICEERAVKACPSGTHSCGDGTCAKQCE